MARVPKRPLRILTPKERTELEALARSRSASADRIARAKEILAVAEGATFVEAARRAGRTSNDSVSALVARFNNEGMAAVLGHHGGGPTVRYGPEAAKRILQEFARTPDPAQDQTTTWSLSALQRALRRAPDGLPQVSSYVILRVLRQAGYTWQKDRAWVQMGAVPNRRRRPVSNGMPRKK